MHPPFGFALFYLRSVAPEREYTDAVTGQRMAPVTIGQIYRGAIPFVLIQLTMVALIIAVSVVLSLRRGEEATGASEEDGGVPGLAGERGVEQEQVWAGGHGCSVICPICGIAGDSRRPRRRRVLRLRVSRAPEYRDLRARRGRQPT